MKKDIHPDYHEITIQMTDGSEFKTRSTFGFVFGARVFGDGAGVRVDRWGGEDEPPLTRVRLRFYALRKDFR